MGNGTGHVCPLFLQDGTGLWSRHESHQPSGPDPAGQEGEGAWVPATFRERNAPTSRVHHAGKRRLCLMFSCFPNSVCMNKLILFAWTSQIESYRNYLQNTMYCSLQDRQQSITDVSFCWVQSLKNIWWKMTSAKKSCDL